MGTVNRFLAFFGFGPEEEARSEAGAAKPKATPRPRRSGDMNEIVTLDPKDYADAKDVAANFRSGVPVIVNIGAMSEADAKRMLDFMLGLKEGLEGHLRRVTPKVFLLSPTNVLVSESDQDGDEVDDLMNS
jgi:cell division inhibitor SepF